MRYADVRQDYIAPKRSIENFSLGATRFFHGLLKKVLIADTAGRVADATFNGTAGELGMAAAWIGAIAYAIQIYFDFSGYSDMAIGIGRMCGVRFVENFRSPYSSSTITEFWRRWHISLSSWFRDYVYIPLGGNRKSNTRTYVNLIVVFLLTGAWHGAAWTFVVWGLFHGVFLILEKVVWGRRAAEMQSAVLKFAYLLPVVLAGWVIFRAESLPQAGAYLNAMVGFGPAPLAEMGAEVSALLSPITLAILALGAVTFLVPRGDGIGRQLERLFVARPALVLAYGIAAAVLASGLALMAEFSPFLYFQF